MPLWHDARRRAGGRVLAAGSADARKASNERSARPQSRRHCGRRPPRSGRCRWDVLDQTAVTATGRFLDEQELLVANHTNDTEPGFWFVAPLELDDDRIVLVSRGWIPRDVAAGQSQQQIEAVDGRVTITGRLFASVDGVGSGRRSTVCLR